MVNRTSGISGASGRASGLNEQPPGAPQKVSPDSAQSVRWGGTDGKGNPLHTSSFQSAKAELQNAVKANETGSSPAEALAALKVLMGPSVGIASSEGLQITNKSLTKEQFEAVLSTVFGASKIQVEGNVVHLADDLATQFAAARRNVKLTAEGTLKLHQDGNATEASALLKALIGDNTTIASSGTVVLKDHAVASANAALTKKFGNDASMTSTIEASVAEDGRAQSTVSISAFKRLKQLGAQDAMTVKADGSFVIKDGSVDRAEVAALVSVIANKQASLDSGGRIVFANGKIEPELNSRLAAAWDNTELEASGSLKFIDGKPKVTGQIKALFKTQTLKTDVAIEADGDSQRVQSKLSALGPNTQLDTTGSLILDKGKLSSANFSTNLVNTADDSGISAGLVYANAENSKSVGSNAGIHLSGNGAKLGILEQVKIFEPAAADADRRAVEKAGGVWAQRTSSFDGSVAVAASGTINVSGVKLGLGFTADATKKRTIELISLHPSKDDALRTSRTGFRLPQTVEDVLAMRPHERVSVTGEQSLGMGGNVSFGLGVPGANASTGASVYHQVTATMRRDVKRLDGNQVRVRFLAMNGQRDVKTLSLTAEAELASKSQIAFKQSLEASDEATSMFDVTIDASTPSGRSALQNILRNDLSEAQYWAAYEGSGVTINQTVKTDVKINTRESSVEMGDLKSRSSQRVLHKTEARSTASDSTLEGAVDYNNVSEVVLPWNKAHKKTQMRYIHQTWLNVSERPPIGDIALGELMHVRLKEPPPPATLSNSRATLVFRARFGAEKTSVEDFTDMASQASAMLANVGYTPDEMIRFSNLASALKAGLLPSKQGTAALLEKLNGVGQAMFDFEGFVGPQAFDTIFYGPKGLGNRTGISFEQAYLDAVAIAPGGYKSILSQVGLRRSIEEHLGASLVPDESNSNFVVIAKQGGQRLGSLTLTDLDKIRNQIIAVEPHQIGLSTPKPISAEVGTWVGTRPKSFLLLHKRDVDRNVKILKPARQFAGAMDRAAKLYTENQPPQQRPNESNEDYAARKMNWEQNTNAPLNKKPEEFYSKMTSLIEQGIGDDPAAAYAMLQLARTEGVFSLANLEIDQHLIVQMEATGTANVQRFGAASLLAGMGLSRKGGTLKLTAMDDQPTALKALKIVFGPNADVDSAGNLFIPQLTEEQFELLSAGRNADGSVNIPPHWDQKRRDAALRATFGTAATATPDNRVVFDNRGYAFVNLGKALDAFWPGRFGPHDALTVPPLLPTAVPHSTPDEAPNEYRVAGRHKGEYLGQLKDFSNAHARTYENVDHQQSPQYSW